MDKRNKLWRREQQNRVFKARMVYHAACGCGIKKADGNWNRHPHWFELGEMDADLQKNRNAMQLLVVPRREV